MAVRGARRTGRPAWVRLPGRVSARPPPAALIHRIRIDGRRPARRLRAAAPVAEEPTLIGVHVADVVHRQAVALEPRHALAHDDVVDLLDAVDRFRRGPLFARLLAILEEVLFPERPAAEDAAGAGRHRHAHLL